MSLLQEAAQLAQENQVKLDKVDGLTTQAKKLLVEHGEDSRKLGLGDLVDTVVFKRKLQPHKKLVREIEGVNVEIFSYSEDLSLFMNKSTVFVVAIPTIDKSLALRGARSVIHDEISHPDSPQSISQMPIADLNSWGDVLDAVEESFRVGQQT